MELKWVRSVKEREGVNENEEMKAVGYRIVDYRAT